jgi:hypothetical protein
MTDARGTIDAWFAAQRDLTVERTPEGGWLTMLAGERKRTIPVYLEVGDHGLSLQSFFMAAPDEQHGEVYGLLLRRNLRSYTLRFALDPIGDVLLVGLVPLAALTAEELDRVLGQLLQVADETYDQALRLGFAAYIEREQAWRAKVGAPRNPIT